MEGLLSFFSPCVLPLVPLYLAYLTKDAKETDEEGNVTYKLSRTLLLTLGFVTGICFVFVLMAAGSGFLHDVFEKQKLSFLLYGGVLLIIAGLFSLHVIQIPFLEKTYQKQMNISGKMNFLKALVLGFFFSFAWSPCIGPMLGQAMLTAASAETKTTGYFYIASYAAGFIVIFLLLGIFTSQILRFLKKNKGIVRYTSVIGGMVVMGMGVYMCYQAHGLIKAYEMKSEEVAEQQTQDETNLDAFDFTLQDAEGNAVSLSDYRGKTIVVNFFGTWCYYCNMEFDGLQKVNDTMADVKVLMIAAPFVNGEGDIASVEAYMKDKGYNMDILYDTDLSVTNRFGVSGYPTTYIVKPDGSFLGYVPGYVPDEDLMGFIEMAGNTEN